MSAKRNSHNLVASNKDILRTLDNEEIEELMELYKKKYTARNFHYILMYNQLKWNQQLRNMSDSMDEKKWIAFRKTFYTNRNTDFRQHGTYISIHWDTIQSISCHSWEPSLRELKECLTKTDLINWRQGPLLTNVDLPLCELLKQTAVSAGTSVQRARTSYGLILPHEKALQLRSLGLPAGYIMKQLSPENAELVHKTWVNNKEGSLQYIKGLMELNRTLGIYAAENNELIAWIFQNDFAGIGILQVQPSEQRKGFGIALATQLSKDIAENEEVELSVWIVSENFKSIALFEKIGFQVYVVNEWIQLSKVN